MKPFDSIQISLNSLCKNNNGFFKSEKQANFLLKMLEENNVFTSQYNGYSFAYIYFYDEQGITKVVKISTTTVKEEIFFERKVKGVLTDSDKKHITKLKRKAKQLEKRIKEREEAFSDGDYSGIEYIYYDANSDDKSYLAKILTAIEDIKGA